MSGPGAERRRSADYAGRFEADGSAWSPWRVVVGFGAVSLAADMVYEGARAVYGPLLASLGATALIVGTVSGVGEAAALLLRLVFGPLADRTGCYWTITLVGYALTAICVPLLAITPFIGGAGLIVAAVLILSERIGKAIRSPAKSALLADAAGQVGMGRGLGVHKALDQIGAFAGPLLVAGMIGASAGIIWPGLAVLAIPGAVAMGLLVLTRRRMPDPDRLATAVGASPPAVGRTERAGASMAERVQRLWMGLPAPFLRLALGTSMCTAGLVTFGLIGFHLVQADLIATAGIPLLYAAAMGAGAIAALVTGEAYDRRGSRILLVLPLLVAAVPLLAFGASLSLVVPGVLLWGAAVGVQDSTVKALVADLVPRERRATAYGLFAGVQGAGALIGGITAGALYEHSLPVLVVVIAGVQLGALLVLLPVLRRAPVGLPADRAVPEPPD